MKIDRFADGLVKIDGVKWFRCKSREAHVCYVSKQPIKAGDLVYRSLQNTQQRYRRILASVIDNPPQE